MRQPWSSSSSAALGGDAGALTLVEGSTFGISLPSGDMLAGFPHGLFFRDTRFLSTTRLRVNGEWPEPLSAHAVYPFSAAMVLRVPPPPDAADSKLLVFRERHVGHGMRDDVMIRNYGTEPSHCTLDIELDADFADLFEVKAGASNAARAHTFEPGDRRFVWSYQRDDFRRATIVDFSQAVAPRDGLACFDFVVPPTSTWQLCLELTPVIDDEAMPPRHRCGEAVELSEPVTRLEHLRRSRPVLAVDDEGYDRMLRRAEEDLAALRISDPAAPDRPVVAAGAPWFMTLFGRDSLLTSWMALLVDPDLAIGTLQTLARYQGRAVDDRTEEQPGRILHEVRFGEAASLSLGGGNVYYGSIDATPLFVMLVGELHRWGLGDDAVRSLLPAVDRALAWIDEYGDLDGDGYVEYRRQNEHGLLNQGWKDSFDSIRFADGRLGEPPIALCEVQGYVYAALIARARIARADGEDQRASGLEARARGLRERFNRDFWLPDRGWIALALDCEKRPVDALTSNIGHCLWTGILYDELAVEVAARLVAPDMFSGWGIRTLSSRSTGYNPASYHNGSVWPHDNAICAAGLARYGMHDAAEQVLTGVVDAAASFDDRLPELFTGLAPDDTPFPVRYPTSCSPQAWAAAAPLMMLRTVLGLEPDVPGGVLQVRPAVPAWMGRVRLAGVPLGDGRLSLEAHTDTVRILEVPPGLTVTDGSPGS